VGPDQLSSEKKTKNNALFLYDVITFIISSLHCVLFLFPRLRLKSCCMMLGLFHFSGGSIGHVRGFHLF